MKISVTTAKWKTKEIEALIVPMGVKEKSRLACPMAEQLLSDTIKRKEFTVQRAK